MKQLGCNHRLILSGTPIQNNVLELWSLFDFLIPGFLGTEKQFQARYGRPILQSRDAKSSSKEQELGKSKILLEQTCQYMYLVTIIVDIHQYISISACLSVSFLQA